MFEVLVVADNINAELVEDEPVLPVLRLVRGLVAVQPPTQLPHRFNHHDEHSATELVQQIHQPGGLSHGVVQQSHRPVPVPRRHIE